MSIVLIRFIVLIPSNTLRILTCQENESVIVHYHIQCSSYAIIIVGNACKRIDYRDMKMELLLNRNSYNGQRNITTIKNASLQPTQISHINQGMRVYMLLSLLFHTMLPDWINMIYSKSCHPILANLNLLIKNSKEILKQAFNGLCNTNQTDGKNIKEAVFYPDENYTISNSDIQSIDDMNIIGNETSNFLLDSLLNDTASNALLSSSTINMILGDSSKDVPSTYIESNNFQENEIQDADEHTGFPSKSVDSDRYKATVESCSEYEPESENSDSSLSTESHTE
ncbi:uncharacterized protein [Prorops nasuta]|uniref:uncharacterized protein isoform X2 n=1 Tax=Prorops nasuta TaxID=863751 RepID=UPI0034CE4FEA